jgi:hypothetical protein
MNDYDKEGHSGSETGRCHAQRLTVNRCHQKESYEEDKVMIDQ